MAVEHCVSVVKGGLVSFSGLRALMQGLARALLNALDSALVLLMTNPPKIYK